MSSPYTCWKRDKSQIQYPSPAMTQAKTTASRAVIMCLRRRTRSFSTGATLSHSSCAASWGGRKAAIKSSRVQAGCWAAYSANSSPRPCKRRRFTGPGQSRRQRLVLRRYVWVQLGIVMRPPFKACDFFNRAQQFAIFLFQPMQVSGALWGDGIVVAYPVILRNFFFGFHHKTLVL